MRSPRAKNSQENVLAKNTRLAHGLPLEHLVRVQLLAMFLVPLPNRNRPGSNLVSVDPNFSWLALDLPTCSRYNTYQQ